MVFFAGPFGIMAKAGILIKKRHWIDLLQHKVCVCVHVHVGERVCVQCLMKI